MVRLQSGIGIAQRKHTALRTKAQHYRRMAMAIQAGTVAHEFFPKYVPRGKSLGWYLQQAERLEQASVAAGEMASLLVDMEHRNYLAALSSGEAWAKLVGTYGLRGDERNGPLADIPSSEVFPQMHSGRLQSIAAFIAVTLADDLPYLAPKLTPAQRFEAAEYLRTCIEETITLLRSDDGRPRDEHHVADHG